MVGYILISLNKKLSIKESIQKILLFLLPINIDIWDIENYLGYHATLHNKKDWFFAIFQEFNIWEERQIDFEIKFSFFLLSLQGYV